MILTIHGDDTKITIDGYNLIKSDHSSDSKKGRVCIFHKYHIPLILRVNNRKKGSKKFAHKMKNVF